MVLLTREWVGMLMFEAVLTMEKVGMFNDCGWFNEELHGTRDCVCDRGGGG